MARYIDADKLSIYFNALAEHAEMEGLQNMAHIHRRCLQRIAEEPTADVVPKSEVAELLRFTFNDDCACNYNGNDEWLPLKCKYGETDCPMPKERLGCWKEFVEYGLAELKQKYTEGETDG